MSEAQKILQLSVGIMKFNNLSNLGIYMKRWTIQTTAGILLSVLTFQNCKFVQGGPQQETTGSSEPTSLSRQFAKSDRPVFAYYKGDGRGKDLPGF